MSPNRFPSGRRSSSSLQEQLRGSRDALLRSALVHQAELNLSSFSQVAAFLPPVSAAAHTGLEAQPALRPLQGRPGRTQTPNQTPHNPCSLQGSSCWSQPSKTTVPTLESSSFLLALKVVAAPSQLDGPLSLDIRSELGSGVNVHVVHGLIPLLAE